MWKVIRNAIACACVLIWSLIAFAASAVLVPTPDGYDSGGHFSDENGYLEEEHGDATTWAEVRGNLKANDTDKTKSKSGGALDKTDCVGTISGAEVPAWVVDLSTRMVVESSGYRSASFDRDMNATARGVIAIYGDVPEGEECVKAAEAKTSTTAETGPYNIVEVIAGNDIEFEEGGMCKRPSDPLADREVSFEMYFDHKQFGKNGEVIRFTYESRAAGSMNIDFVETGDEKVLFDVRQNQLDEELAGDWAGLAVAWDLIAYPNPYIVQAFVLE